MEQIKVYGTKWCPDCARAKQVLSRHNVPFTWVDIENDEKALEYVLEVNHGYQSVPTIIFPDGSVLVEPSNIELEKKLAEIN
ncbi:MAG: glutaredoxin domain-containing protein [Dehalococcoidales bacterium]